MPHSLGNATVFCARCGVAGTGVAQVGTALSSCLASHQPIWDFLHPWTHTEGELVIFPLGISAQRQVNHQAEAVLRILHRLQSHPVPRLDHASNFQGSLKIQMKTNKVLIFQKETVG